MASALVGGAFLSASSQFFLEKIASKEFRDLLKSKKLNISLLDELKRTLLTLQAVLVDAEEKQITNSSIKDWLDLVKDAVLDAEDLLDEVNTQALGHKVEAEYPHNSINSLVCYFLSSPFQFHLKMNSKLETMCRRLQIIATQVASEFPFPRLKDLKLIKCPKLKGYLPQHLSSLKELEIKECDQLESTPSVTLVPWIMTIEKHTHTGQGQGLQHLTSLKFLSVNDCPRLKSLPEENLPSSLSALIIKKCPLLEASFLDKHIHRIGSMIQPILQASIWWFDPEAVTLE
ncbi:hypothetical protein L6164_017926 [Bauhinia variegata]|uniref:Uncharacterized protein n=1 Tax=Bauhinia variegata TaxID=167791 RepID=A0ACB9ND01_BAUVA|nr:hypothetical protein L6164_017926 [Bauhinia variegata]